MNEKTVIRCDLGWALTALVMQAMFLAVPLTGAWPLPRAFSFAVIAVLTLPRLVPVTLCGLRTYRISSEGLWVSFLWVRRLWTWDRLEQVWMDDLKAPAEPCTFLLARTAARTQQQAAQRWMHPFTIFYFSFTPERRDWLEICRGRKCDEKELDRTDSA